MSDVFYGQDSLVEDNTRYDEIGVFLPNSHFLKNLERHVFQSRGDHLCRQLILTLLILWKKIIWRFHGMTTPMMTVMC